MPCLKHLYQIAYANSIFNCLMFHLNIGKTYYTNSIVWEIVKSIIYAWFLHWFSFLFSLSFCPLMNIKRGPSFCASQSAGWVSKCHFLHSVPCLEPNNLSEYATSVTAPKTSLLLCIILFTWLTIDLTVPFLFQFYLQIRGHNHFCVTTYSNIYYDH